MPNKEDNPESMEIKINRKELLNALTNMKSITSGRHTLEILSSVLIEAKDNTVKITATDLEIGFQGIYPAKIISPGSVAIPNKELLNFISKSKAGEISIKEKEKRWIGLFDDSVSFNIACMNVDDFPLLPEEINADTQVEVDAFILKNMIVKAVASKPQDEVEAKKLYKAGSLFKVIKNEERYFLCAVGTNGGVLTKESKEVSVSGEVNETLTKDGALIPKSSLTKLNNSLLRSVKRPVKKAKRKNEGFDFGQQINDNIFMGVQNGHIKFKRENEAIIIRLIDSEFPSYEMILREEENKIIVDKKILLDAMKQMTTMQSTDYKAVDVTIEKDKIRMCFSNPDLGEMQKDIPIQYNGVNIEAVYYPDQFVKFLQLMDSDVVDLDIIDDIMAPCLIIGEQDEGVLFAIMPCRK